MSTWFMDDLKSEDICTSILFSSNGKTKPQTLRNACQSNEGGILQKVISLKGKCLGNYDVELLLPLGVGFLFINLIIKLQNFTTIRAS